MIDPEIIQKQAEAYRREWQQIKEQAEARLTWLDGAASALEALLKEPDESIERPPGEEMT